MKKILLLFCLIQFQLLLLGQATQEVSVRVFPKGAFLKIDTQLIIIAEQSTPFILSLEQGRYPIEIWASRFELFRDTLVVDSNNNTYSKALTKRSSSFDEFKIERNNYNKARLKRTGLTAGLIAANVGALYWSVTDSRLKKLERDASRLQEAHLNLATPASLQANRTAYENVRKKHDRNRTITTLKRTVGIPLIGLSIFFSQRYIKKMWSKKLEPPKIKEDKNPFVFNNLELINADANYQLSLTFKF